MIINNIRDNFDDEKKEHLKKEDNKRKKSVIALGMMRKNKLEKIIRKGRWINVYKL